MSRIQFITAYERIIAIVITSYPIVRDRGDFIFVSSFTHSIFV